VKYFACAVLCIVAALGVRSGFGRTSCPDGYEVRIVGAAPDAPAVAGRCEIERGKPVFHPAFPLMEGVQYSIRAGGREIERIGVPSTRPAPSVTARVFPTSDVLPANQLKLYVEFSAPVSLGEARRRIRLLDANGAKVQNAFLTLDEEMWDADRRRLTLLFEPGRVKRGLKANLQGGAPLRAGESYTLVVDAGWPDAHGAPLLTGPSKRFSVGPADRRTPDPATWSMTTPAAESREPLVLSFAEAMDHAVALLAVGIVDDRGQRVAGSATLAARESEWRFTPARPWAAEPHTLSVDSRIEDLAGNNLVRPFDLDLRPSTPPLRRETTDAFRTSFTPGRHSSRKTTIGSTRVARLAGM
jgi:hypothetical protein